MSDISAVATTTSAFAALIASSATVPAGAAASQIAVLVTEVRIP